MRNVKAERPGIGFALSIAFPSGIADMKVCRMVDKQRKQFETLRIKNGVDGRMPTCRRLASFHLLSILKIAAVGKANGEMKPFCLSIEMLIVRFRVDTAENCILRFAFPAAGARDSAYSENIAS
jgi:hypothetical protein